MNGKQAKLKVIVIRQVEEADIPAFREILDEVCRERRFLAMLEAPPFDGFHSFVVSNITSGIPQLVAVEDAQIVGWCDVLPGEVGMGTAHVGRLGMGVRKSHRRRGIGRLLAESTISCSREIGLEKIELGVYSSNEVAVALYRKMGFAEEGRKKRGRLVDGVYDDVILMALHLRPKPDSP